MSSKTQTGKEVQVKSESPPVSPKQGKCTVPHFADPPLPVTALASFPGSGNTWVRFLLEQITGKSPNKSTLRRVCLRIKKIFTINAIRVKRFCSNGFVNDD